MVKEFCIENNGLKHYHLIIYGTIVWIDETLDDLWKVQTIAPFGEVGLFVSLPEAYVAAEEECYQIEQEAREKRSQYQSTNEEF